MSKALKKFESSQKMLDNNPSDQVVSLEDKREQRKNNKKSFVPRDPKSVIPRFIEAKQREPKRIFQLIKVWVHSEDPKAKLACKFLGTYLDDSSLNEILATLSHKQRSRWSMNMSQELKVEELDKIKNMIEISCLECQLKTDLIKDHEVLDYAAKLTDHQLMEFIDQSEANQKILFAFESDKVSKILSQLDENQIHKLLGNLTELSATDEIESSDLKESLKEYCSSTQKNELFSDGLPDILKSLDPFKAGELVTKVMKNLETNEALALVADVLPVNLVFELDAEKAQAFFDELSLQEKIELSLSSESELRGQIEEICFPEGSKAREMYDLEISNIEADEAALQSLKKGKVSYWRNFSKIFRQRLSDSEYLQNEINAVIETWVKNHLKS